MDPTEFLDVFNKIKRKIEQGRPIYKCDQLFKAVYESAGVHKGVRKLVHENDLIGFETEISVLLPPCAIPLWQSLTRVVTCEWRHWLADRKPVVVNVYGEERIAMEIARDYEQLGILIALDLLEADGGDTQEFYEYMEIFGLSDVNQLINHWELYGDAPHDLRTLSAFGDNAPLFCLPGPIKNYTGDFPNENTFKLARSLKSACTYEIHDRFKNGLPVLKSRKELESLDNCPIWLKHTHDQSANFELLMNKGDLEGAWMCICSAGWTFGDAKLALRDLLEKIDNDLLKIQVDTWSYQQFEDSTRY